MRRAVKAAYKHEGMVSVYQCMGEIANSLEIVGEVAQELLEEEEKNRQK